MSQTLVGLAAMLAVGLPIGRARAQTAGDRRPSRILFFTRSQGFEHEVVRRRDNNSDKALSPAEQILVDLGKQHNLEVTATKDGRLFTAEGLSPYDGVVFYTTGDLEKPGTDGTPPMPSGGKQTLLDFIAGGKGFVGVHCATDTFKSRNDANVDPYIEMIGGEFDGHEAQERAAVHAVGQFAPLADQGNFELHEEWYRLKNLAPDLHAIFVQQTQSMKGEKYRARKPYPNTWARQHGKGRIFYTSLGHRQDVWTDPMFHQILLAGLGWTLGRTEADIRPNLQTACPGVEKVRPG